MLAHLFHLWQNYVDKSVMRCYAVLVECSELRKLNVIELSIDLKLKDLENIFSGVEYGELTIKNSE